MFFQACPNIDEKSKLIDSAKMAREERAIERKKEISAIKIQTLIRKYLARYKFANLVRSEIDTFLQIPEDLDSDYKPDLKPAQDVYHLIKKFLMVFKLQEDRLRFEYVCRYIMLSMSSETINKTVYASLVLSKQLVLLWISQVKHLLTICLQYYLVLKPEQHRDSKLMMTLLLFQVTFTNVHNWKFLNSSKSAEVLKLGLDELCKSCLSHLASNGLYPSLRTLLISGLCKPKPTFTSAPLTAIITLAIRPLLACDFEDSLLTSLLLEVMSVPGLLHHIKLLSLESLAQLMTQRVFSKCLDLLQQPQAAKIVFNALEGNYCLCLLANLIQLGNAEKEGLVDSTRKFMAIATKLLQSCRCYVESKKSHLSQWHPVLGWFAQKTDPCLQDSMAVVSKQLNELWSVNMIRIFFEPLFSLASSIHPPTSPSLEQHNANKGKEGFLKKALDRLSIQSGGSGGGANSYRLKIDSQVVVDTCAACNVYLTAIHCLTQLRMEIMAGLCFQDILLPHLWLLITNLGPQCGLKLFLDAMLPKPSSSSSSSSSPPSTTSPPLPLFNDHHHIFSLLQLACNMAKHVITILDDVEMYEQEQPFPLHTLATISHFLNHLVYRSIWNGHIDVTKAAADDTFNSMVSLLLTLHSRDCRRSFTPADHWLIKDVKSSTFMSDLAHSKPVPLFLLQKVPHIIPHKERISLFRKLVAKDKEALGISCAPNHNQTRSSGISIHRRRIVEDGYRQLALFSATALKGVIRVKFINEQGLDEAGIDQDGVFKEFLEETIKRVFDPALNLFKVTTEQKLYPSPTSHLQDNYLALFDFVGRVLGKAVYEGIVVDVPFASFFLSQLLGHTSSTTYSSIDELPSLDPELYKSLSCIKRYEGDVRDLDLTFSYDEDIMGRLVTHELIPGGRAYPVTNENRISYLHLMAHFKMQVVIREQCNAFITGFKSIINSEWLAMFSGPELQKLISGDTNDINLCELRKHTHYYGGFHNNHRVINWLWSILQKDFTPHERRLFLKFVTSCSKGPLLGFSYLEPPFSIRCVEVSEDQDGGDTVSSVLKGFFNIRRRDPVGRLPTSSTCFNLLKLPNYQKKSTLRDKLRYSITSNTGFELS